MNRWLAQKTIMATMVVFGQLMIGCGPLPEQKQDEPVSSGEDSVGAASYENVPLGRIDRSTTQGTLTLLPEAGWFAYPVLEHELAYREDHEVAAEIELADASAVSAAHIRVAAYNDDKLYARAVWFEIDGRGGYLGTLQAPSGGPGQVRGSGVLGPEESGLWEYDLSAVTIGHTANEGVGPGGVVSMLDLLRTPGPHRIVMWVSTYAQYGPASWVSLDLIVGRPRVG